MKAYELEVSKPDSDDKIVRKFAAENAKNATELAEKIGFTVHEVLNPDPEKKKASKVETPTASGDSTQPAEGSKDDKPVEPAKPKAKAAKKAAKQKA